MSNNLDKSAADRAIWTCWQDEHRAIAEVQQEQATYSPKSLEGCRMELSYSQNFREIQRKKGMVDILGAAAEVTNECNHAYKPPISWDITKYKPQLWWKIR